MIRLEKGTRKKGEEMQSGRVESESGIYGKIKDRLGRFGD